MDRSKNPTNDRDEFISRLNNLFRNSAMVEEYVEALMEENLERISFLKSEKKKLKEKIEYYTDAYDRAQNEEQRKRVVGSVKYEFEPKR